MVLLLQAKSGEDLKRLKDDVEKTRKQITKAKVLADKFGGKENTEESVEKSASPNSNGELIAENAKLARDSIQYTLESSRKSSQKSSPKSS